MLWPIPVGDLTKTGWRFGQYRRRYIFQDLGRFEVEIGKSKDMGGLRLCLDMGSRIKKNRFCLKSDPFKNRDKYG